MAWKSGRGLLGRLRPLIGCWTTETGSGDSQAARMTCTRVFSPFGKGWITLDARWGVGSEREYREQAFFGLGDDGFLACLSFTSDGKRSVGRLADGSDVAGDAIAFEAQMPAGLARIIYWPPEGGGPGFRFAVESKTKKGWNRFLEQRYLPA